MYFLLWVAPDTVGKRVLLMLKLETSCKFVRKPLKIQFPTQRKKNHKDRSLENPDLWFPWVSIKTIMTIVAIYSFIGA